MDYRVVDGLCSRIIGTLHDYWSKVHEGFLKEDFVLYQYTDVSALQGIIKNNGFWATHFRYLNDKKELDFGLYLVLQFISNNGNKYSGQCTKVFFDEIKDICLNSSSRGELPFHGVDIYSISLSSKGDLLSQWRGYGKKYRSVCIGFDVNKLECDVVSGGRSCILRKIIYNPVDQTNIIEAYMNEACRVLENNENLFMRDNDLLIETKRQIYTGILATALCFKEKCWEEEDEWRLIMLPYDSVRGNNLEVCFREGNSGLIPYVNAQIFANGSAIEAVKKVILPKSGDFIRSKKAIDMFFRQIKNNIKVPIIESKISIVY